MVISMKYEVSITTAFDNAPSEICGHAYTLSVDGVAFSVSNVFKFGKYDPEVRDRVMYELKELLTKHGNWVFGLSKEELKKTIEAQVAVNRAARKGLYKDNPGYVSEWLEGQMKNSLRWMKEDKEGELIARVLLAIETETYGSFYSRFRTRKYASWKIAKDEHAEALFEKKAAELFAVA